MSQHVIMAVIEQLQWHTAKTMPHIPHEYTVRGRDGSEEDYAQLSEAIERDGVFERWKGRKKRYLHPGDGWKYWNQPPHPIINRMRVEDDADRLRHEGQLLRDALGKPIEAARDGPRMGSAGAGSAE